MRKPRLALWVIRMHWIERWPFGRALWEWSYGRVSAWIGWCWEQAHPYQGCDKVPGPSSLMRGTSEDEMRKLLRGGKS